MLSKCGVRKKGRSGKAGGVAKRHSQSESASTEFSRGENAITPIAWGTVAVDRGSISI
nr:hypothetical protein Itr_chr14CG30190 [Ipomoea trifida]GMD91388.1 hypothetical protein Iba_chr14dCG18890 [Ipomoea batatas]